MPSQLVTAPTAEPISVEEARRFCRVDDDFSADDDLLQSLIVAARQDAEKVTWRALVTQTWKMVVDRFPRPRSGFGNASWYGPDWGAVPGPIMMASQEGKTGFEFFLPKPPLVTVDSIKYVDPAFPYTITARGTASPSDADGANGDVYWRTSTDDIYLKATGTWGSPVRKFMTTLAVSQYLVDAISEPGRVTPAYGVTWPETRDQANAVEINFTCGYGSAAAVPEGIKRWMRLRVATLYNNREEVAILARGKVEALPYADGLLDDYRVKSF